MTQNEPSFSRIVEINKEPVELCKILKFENMVQSGGESKFVISEGLVRLNGKIETRKRKKRKRGKSFFFNDTATTEIYTLSLHDALPIFIFSLSCEFNPPENKTHLIPLFFNSS